MLFSGTNLAMTRGDSEWLWVRITDREGNHVPFVAGDIIYFTVKDDTRTEVIRIQKIITEFIEGKAYITIDPIDTKGMEYGKYSYDVQITFASGVVKTVIRPSVFEILDEVTYD